MKRTVNQVPWNIISRSSTFAQHPFQLARKVFRMLQKVWGISKSSRTRERIDLTLRLYAISSLSLPLVLRLFLVHCHAPSRPAKDGRNRYSPTISADLTKRSERITFYIGLDLSSPRLREQSNSLLSLCASTTPELLGVANTNPWCGTLRYREIHRK